MTSCMWTTNATSGMICRYVICNFCAKKLRLFERGVNTLQGRVVEFAPGEQSVDRTSLHSVCKEKIHTNCTQNIYLYGRELQTSKTDHQARSHSPTKFRPLTSAGVAKWDLKFWTFPKIIACVSLSGLQAPLLRKMTELENWRLWWGALRRSWRGRL